MDWVTSLIAGSYDTGHAEIVFRFSLAIVLGAVIGLERELRDHPAGLRTHILVALAASLFTIITFELFHELTSASSDSRADPIRVIEAVTAGVSFLAAGTIIQSRGEVSGLTTGAAMWLAGAVGVACGLGYYLTEKRVSYSISQYPPQLRRKVKRAKVPRTLHQRVRRSCLGTSSSQPMDVKLNGITGA